MPAHTEGEPGDAELLGDGCLVEIGSAVSSEPCKEELEQRPGAQSVNVAGALGQVLSLVDEAGQYLVQTFDGELARVHASDVLPLGTRPPLDASAVAGGGAEPRRAGFDAAFPASLYQEGAFLQKVIDALSLKGYCVVQMTSRPSSRREAAYEAEDMARWERPICEFENFFMGRTPAGKRISWLSSASPDGGAGRAAPEEDRGLEAFDHLLHDVANLVMPETPLLGFVASSRTNGMLQGPCPSDEEAELIEQQHAQASISSQDLMNHLAFYKRRKLGMMYFVSGTGGVLSLHPLDGSEATKVPCVENQLVLFRHDLMDYEFAPAPKQLALQAWILREQLEGEEGLEGEYSGVAAAEGLLDGRGRRLPVAPTYLGARETVDVTSLACRVSGDVWSPEDYWSLLTGSADSIVGVPLSRWDHDLYYSEEQGVPGKGYVRHFGFLDTDQLATFDSAFFGMKREDAERIDPVQRVGLEVGYESLFRAGWTKATLQGAELVACYAYAPSEWTGGARHCRLGPGPSEELFRENTAAACAARLHYLFGVTGPSSTVETACSSSLTAAALVHSQMRPERPEAVKVSMRRQMRFGLAMGLNSYFDPFYTIGLCGASMLTHQGRCFTFDMTADGFVRGEGYTAMHYRVSEGEDLSRLAMLCGTCVNQDGRSASLTAPHGPSQQECIRHSLREAGIRSLDIQIQELHGTGTALGDPIEVGALRATMMMFEGEQRVHPLVKTSSKSNIGHSEMNAGGCGILKCVLMGIYCSATGNVHLRYLNPHIDVVGYPVYFASEVVDQGKSEGYHGVSSFGFGGSNARGDVWARAQSGPRTTQPSGLPLDLTRGRLEELQGLFGVRCLPGVGDAAAVPGGKQTPLPDLPASRRLQLSPEDGTSLLPLAASKDAAVFSGNYLTGGLGPLLRQRSSFEAAGLRVVARGSFNGWSAAVTAEFNEDLQLFTFAFRLGETLVEHFKLSCEGLGEIFPDCEGASSEALILGPGQAPAGYYWMVDGRDDEASEGTVYRVVLKWDAASGRKQISWMPSSDPLSLDMVGPTPFRHRYHVVASWNAWAPTPMQDVVGEPGSFETTVRIGLSGREAFFFQRDGDASQAVYPSRDCAALGELSVPVRGPDRRDAGRRWRVAGDTGDLVTLRLRVAGGGVEVSVAGPRARRLFRRDPEVWRSYAVVCKTGFVQMEGQGPDMHRARLSLDGSGCEEFQIVIGEDLEQAIYPELFQAGSGISAALGPDGKGKGMYWLIEGQPLDEAVITLDLAQADRRRQVSWTTSSPLAGAALQDGAGAGS